MLQEIDLSRRIDKKSYKKMIEPLGVSLGRLQREVRKLGIPLVVVFEGWDAAGKGTLINELILPMDPRGFTVHTCQESTEEEKFRPFLWQFWRRLPAAGRQAIFDRSWYRRLMQDRVEGDCRGESLVEATDDILSFERQLVDDGTVIVKFFLHISRKTQKRRLKKLRNDPNTAWRVSKADLRRHKRYDKYFDAAEEMLAATDTEHAPWTIIEARDRRFAALKIFNTVIAALENRIAAVESDQASAPAQAEAIELPDELRTSILDPIDLSVSLEKDEYSRQLKALQKRIRDLHHQMYIQRVPAVVAYEGWDAAGKGGNIRRLTARLDPRGYEVIPIAAPDATEKAHHYLWRFWRELPKAGHLAIFDRTWYGRVLVERVEGFASRAEWKRAYREINEMEKHLTNYGMVLLKFWLQIDAEEQLARFEARQENPDKTWKITEEDWRNREQWDQYNAAVEEMLFRTSTPHAPWTIVESNDKRYARVKVLRSVCQALEDRLG